MSPPGSYSKRPKIDFRLESPRIPRRRSSFSHSTKAQKRHLLGSDDENPADGGYCYDRSSRQGFSSNTWTSSSGCGSEDDGSDDRTLFVQEYNRLAKKVRVMASFIGLKAVNEQLSKVRGPIDRPR